MSNYILEAKQIVEYPRCRVYREFIQSLISDRSVRSNNGCSGLFSFAVLCSYANFRTSYRRLDGINYTIYPGEWVCRISELGEWLRIKRKSAIIDMLYFLQDIHLIEYSLLGRDQIVKYRIVNWRRHNTVLDYNCPCQKETGFFFIPISTASELISIGRCSEIDIILDLWISAVYNDEQVQGSFTGPVVYFRNGSGCPLVSYADLAERWGISKATVGRILKKLSSLGYISLLTFPGRHGTAIYLQNYLSTMFQISDVLVDKEEVAMCLNIKIPMPESEMDSSVSNDPIIVSKPPLDLAAKKVLQVLALQGIPCAKCSGSIYKLFPYADVGESKIEAGTADPRLFRMDVLCPSRIPVYSFELKLTYVQKDAHKGGCIYA